LKTTTREREIMMEADRARTVRQVLIGSGSDELGSMGEEIAKLTAALSDDPVDTGRGWDAIGALRYIHQHMIARHDRLIEAERVGDLGGVVEVLSAAMGSLDRCSAGSCHEEIAGKIRALLGGGEGE
jgi:hypothetical protein